MHRTDFFRVALLLCLVFSETAVAQYWAKTAATTSITSYVVDASGFITVAGVANGTLNLGLGGASHPFNATGFFLARYAPDGTFIRAVTSTGTPLRIGLFSDGLNRIVVTARPYSTLDIDPGPGVRSIADGAVFAAFDTMLTMTWASHLTGQQVEIRDIEITPDRSLIVLGDFGEESVDLDPGAGSVSYAIQAANAENRPESALFVAKYSMAGAHVWSKVIGNQHLAPSFSSNHWIYGRNVELDSGGNIVLAAIAGFFENLVLDVDPGPGTVSIAQHQSLGSGSAALVLKLNGSGSFLWHRAWPERSVWPITANFFQWMEIGISSDDHIHVLHEAQNYSPDFSSNLYDLNPTAAQDLHPVGQDDIAAAFTKLAPDGRYIRGRLLGQTRNNKLNGCVKIDASHLIKGPNGTMNLLTATNFFVDYIGDTSAHPFWPDTVVKIPVTGEMVYFRTLISFDSTGRALWGQTYPASADANGYYSGKPRRLDSGDFVFLLKRPLFNNPNPATLDLDPGPGSASVPRTGWEHAFGRFNATGSLTAGGTLSGTEGWRIVAAPGAGTPVSSFLSPLWTQGYPGSDAPQGVPNVFSYSGGQWNPVTDGTFQVGPASPVAVYVYSDDDPVTPGVQGGFPKSLFTGASQSQSTSLNLTYHQASANGWNLMANPFATSLMLKSLALDANTSINNNVWVWNASTGNYSILDGTTTSQARIAPMQGFFLLTSAAGQSVALTMQSWSYGGSSYNKPAQEPSLVLQAKSGLHTGTLKTAFRTDASEHEDDWDAPFFPSLNSERLDFWTSSGSRKLSIDARPPAAGQFVYPIQIEGTVSGPVELSIESLSGFPETSRIHLLNSQGQQVTLLEAGASFNGSVTIPEIPAALTLTIGLGAQTRSGSIRPDESPLDVAAWPNPFNPTTNLRIQAPARGHYSLELYDITGRLLKRVADGELSSSQRTFTVDGSSLSSGVYVARLKADGRIATTKLVLQK